MMRLCRHSNGDPSASKTWAAVFNAVILFKFALSGVSIGGVVFGTFDATAAAALAGVVNAIYVAREYQNKQSLDGK